METKPVDILLIEDDQDDVFLIEKIFEKDGANLPPVRIKTAASLQEGFTVIDQQNVDLILLDLSLPDSRGIESLKLVLQRAPEYPVVVITAFDDESTAMDAMSCGAQDYIVKDHLSPTYFKRNLFYAIERQRIKKELSELNNRLQELTQIDPLTGLLNRRGLDQVLSKNVCRKAAFQESDVMAILIDLDNFKHVNDSFGHKTGDVVLNDVARALNGAIRASDYAARVGGDEFLVLLPGTRQAEGFHVAEKIRLAISSSSFAFSQGTQFKVTASLGLITVDQNFTSIDELLEHTHSALSRSKIAGKNNVFWNQDGREEKNSPLSDIQNKLREKSSYKVLGQGIFFLPDMKKVGYELFSRSTVEHLEMPVDFFRYCQEANYLTTVDHHCLRNCESASRSSNEEGVRFHLNIFPSTLLEIPVERLVHELENNRVSKDRYCLEISEQQIIGDPTYLMPAVTQLKREGVRVAIDDVGFGRSCLESLILLEPDVIKIDKGCIVKISSDPARVRSLKRILNVANALETEVIAEGIESKEDLDVLQDLGVKYGQGFFLEKPHEFPATAAV